MIGARASFCAAHRLPQHPEVHGHSYEVWAFTDSGCVEAWQETLRATVKILDHGMLNEELSTMEQLAYWIAKSIDAKKVQVIRPVEGLCAEFIAT